MKIVLFGKNGQLGWELERSLQCFGQVLALDYPEADFMKPTSLRRAVVDFGPHIVINASAYTDVDNAEVEREKARTINVDAPAILAATCQKISAVFLHYSTDYVFNGKKGTPYNEDDSPDPLNFYGTTKLEGERAVFAAGADSLVFRTAWLYSLRRDNFVTKVLRWARTQPEIHVVEDQISNPTWARSLAEITAALLAKAGKNPVKWLSDRAGLYHIAGSGHASRLEWAKSIIANDPLKSEHLVRSIHPARSGDFVTMANRPSNSALDCGRFERAFILSLPGWEYAIRLAMST